MKCLMLAFLLIAGRAWAATTGMATPVVATPVSAPHEVPSQQSLPEVPAAAGQSETPLVPEPQGALTNAKDQRHQVSTVCRKDREKFCREIKGAAKINKCLAAHYDRLSEDCRAMTKAH